MVVALLPVLTGNSDLLCSLSFSECSEAVRQVKKRIDWLNMKGIINDADVVSLGKAAERFILTLTPKESKALSHFLKLYAPLGRHEHNVVYGRGVLEFVQDLSNLPRKIQDFQETDKKVLPPEMPALYDIAKAFGSLDTKTQQSMLKAFMQNKTAVERYLLINIVHALMHGQYGVPEIFEETSLWKVGSGLKEVVTGLFSASPVDNFKKGYLDAQNSMYKGGNAQKTFVRTLKDVETVLDARPVVLRLISALPADYAVSVTYYYDQHESTIQTASAATLIAGGVSVAVGTGVGISYPFIASCVSIATGSAHFAQGYLPASLNAIIPNPDTMLVAQTGMFGLIYTPTPIGKAMVRGFAGSAIVSSLGNEYPALKQSAEILISLHHLYALRGLDSKLKHAFMIPPSIRIVRSIVPFHVLKENLPSTVFEIVKVIPTAIESQMSNLGVSLYSHHIGRSLNPREQAYMREVMRIPVAAGQYMFGASYGAGNKYGFFMVAAFGPKIASKYISFVVSERSKIAATAISALGDGIYAALVLRDVGYQDEYGRVHTIAEGVVATGNILMNEKMDFVIELGSATAQKGIVGSILATVLEPYQRSITGSFEKVAPTMHYRYPVLRGYNTLSGSACFSSVIGSVTKPVQSFVAPYMGMTHLQFSFLSDHMPIFKTAAQVHCTNMSFAFFWLNDTTHNFFNTKALKVAGSIDKCRNAPSFKQPKCYDTVLYSAIKEGVANLQCLDQEEESGEQQCASASSILDITETAYKHVNALTVTAQQYAPDVRAKIWDPALKQMNATIAKLTTHGASFVCVKMPEWAMVAIDSRDAHGTQNEVDWKMELHKAAGFSMINGTICLSAQEEVCYRCDDNEGAAPGVCSLLDGTRAAGALEEDDDSSL